MRLWRAGDRAIGRDVEVGGLMGGGLENDDGEAEFEDDLQRDERVEGVIEALLGGGEEARDEEQRADAGERRPGTGEDGEGYCAIDAEGVGEAAQW